MVVLPIDHITSDPTKRSGKPCVAGTRIAVQDIAAYYNGGWNADKIADELSLPVAPVFAALAYYFDHQPQIDQDIEDDFEAVKKVAISTSELRRQIQARQQS